MPDDHTPISPREPGPNSASARPISDDFVIIANAPSPDSTPTRVTQCSCEAEGRHLKSTILDIVIPRTPQRVHCLMFRSSFLKEFMGNNQKLRDIHFSDPHPISPSSTLTSRNISYIKPLTCRLGPKQTKCEFTEETLHFDVDDCICTATSTKTPDVPERERVRREDTHVHHAGEGSSRVVVTSEVEWTGKSFIRGIIEKSAVDGQKVYHGALEVAMRAYIAECQSEGISNVTDLTPPAALLVNSNEDAEPLPKHTQEPQGQYCLYQRILPILKYTLNASSRSAKRALTQLGMLIIHDAITVARSRAHGMQQPPYPNADGIERSFFSTTAY